ncbi:MAG TPA: Ti-type conjugative transfer relaxase TraA [Allosphingosinicella sp.]|nr:Ti-type conjugative transfer relaxase TraA [Allosphingosinicella sp.]
MAIYHFSAKVISRAAGSSALAAAAYRSASRLHDERLGRSHDFTNKAGVIHSEVMLPDGAPEQYRDRAALWNAVEAAELRKDAQLAREIEFALPRELEQAEGIRLARDFVEREFVAHGMVADLNVHWDIGADGEPKPHAHVMLSMRELGPDGFQAKVREWNRTALLQHWRERWADHVNDRLAALDIDVRIDHRSLEAQGIELEPQHKIGPAASRMAEGGLALERIEEHRDIARRNGEKLLANPELALDAITSAQATFTRRDAAMFVHRHSEGKEQFDAIMAAIRASDQVVYVGKDGRGEERFTSRAMLETEQRLERATAGLEARRRHIVSERDQARALAAAERRGMVLSGEQRDAFEQLTKPKGLGVVIGYAGTGKSAMLGVAREAWEQAGYRVQSAALSGIAAENLEAGSGIASRTLASLEHQWAQDRELLGSNDVLVIDEAGMIGTRQMERVISEAERRGAKVVLVGDPEQLQAIEAGGAFRSIAERHGAHELIQVRRQREDWQRDATRMLATERTAEALQAYAEHGALNAAETREAAREALVDRWDRERIEAPSESRIILTHTNDEVRAINELARERMRANGALGEDVTVRADKGERRFAAGDRIMFLRNERSLGVKNGSLGRVDSVTAVRMAVMLDDGRAVAYDLKDYAHVEHGYAATIHKAQGMTVDKVHVLATPGLDRHAAYVALSRHRDSVDLHYGRDDFADQGKLARVLSRERAKDMASDYAHTPELAPGTRGRGFADLKLPSARLPERPRGMFEGLQLRVAPGVAVPAPDLGAAVQRYARAFAEVDEAERAGREAMPHQRTALARSGEALDSIETDGARDLRTALRRDPDLLEKAKAGDPSPALRAMQAERAVRTDPAKRADRFVRDWRRLDGRARSLTGDGHYDRADKVRDQMGAMAKSLQRDPQVESLLRSRSRELGIGAPSGASISHDLAEHLGVSRGRGIGR